MLCEQKKRYTKAEILLMVKWKTVEREKRMYYYKCHCGWYHLTSQSPQQYRRKKHLAITGTFTIFTPREQQEVAEILKKYCKSISNA